MDPLSPLRGPAPPYLPLAAAPPPGPRDAVALGQQASDQGARFYLERGWRWPWQEKTPAVPPDALPALLAEKPDQVRVRPNDSEHLYPLRSTEDLRELTTLQDPCSPAALKSLASDRWRFYSGEAELGLYGAYNALSDQGQVTARRDHQSLALTPEKAEALVAFYADKSSPWLQLEGQGYRFYTPQGQPLSTFEASQGPARIGRETPWFPASLLTLDDPARLRRQLDEFPHLQEKAGQRAAAIFEQLQSWEGTPAAELARHLVEVAPEADLSRLQPQATLRQLAAREMERLQPAQTLALSQRLPPPRPELANLADGLKSVELQAALARHAFSAEGEDWAARALSEGQGPEAERALLGRRLLERNELAVELLGGLPPDGQVALAGILLEHPHCTPLELARHCLSRPDLRQVALQRLEREPEHRDAARFGLAAQDGELAAYALEHADEKDPAGWGRALQSDEARLAALETLAERHPGAAFYREVARIKKPRRVLDIAFSQTDFAVAERELTKALEGAPYADRVHLLRALVARRDDPPARLARTVAPEDAEVATRVYEAALEARPDAALPEVARAMSKIRNLPLASRLVQELGRHPEYAPCMEWTGARLNGLQTVEAGEALCQAAFANPRAATAEELVQVGRGALSLMERLPWKPAGVEEDKKSLTTALLELREDDASRLGRKLEIGLEPAEAAAVREAALAWRKGPLVELGANLSRKASPALQAALMEAFPDETARARELGGSQSEEGRHALLVLSLSQPGASRAELGLAALQRLEEQPITSNEEKRRRVDLARTLLEERGDAGARLTLELAGDDPRLALRAMMATLKSPPPTTLDDWLNLGLGLRNELPVAGQDRLLSRLAADHPEIEPALSFAREVADRLSDEGSRERLYQSALLHPRASSKTELLALGRAAEPTAKAALRPDAVELRRALVEKVGHQLALELEDPNAGRGSYRLLGVGLSNPELKDYLGEISSRPQFERLLQELPPGARKLGHELLARTSNAESFRAILQELIAHPQADNAAQCLERMGAMLDPQGAGQDQQELSRHYLARLSEQPQSRNLARMAMAGVAAAESGHSAVVIARLAADHANLKTAQELGDLVGLVARQAGGPAAMAMLAELGRTPEMAGAAALASSLALTDREACRLAAQILIEHRHEPEEQQLKTLLAALHSNSPDRSGVARRLLELRSQRDPSARLALELGEGWPESSKLYALALEQPELPRFDFPEAVERGELLASANALKPRLLQAWAERCPVESLRQEMQALSRQQVSSFGFERAYDELLPRVRMAAEEYRTLRELNAPANRQGISERDAQVLVGGVVVKKKD